MKYKRIFDPTYGIAIHMLRNATESSFNKWITKYFKDFDYDENFSDFTIARVITIKQPSDYLIFNTNINRAEFRKEQVVHESVHLAQFILSDRHIPIDDSTREVIAYYTQYVFRELNKFYFSHKKNVKHIKTTTKRSKR